MDILLISGVAAMAPFILMACLDLGGGGGGGVIKIIMRLDSIEVEIQC